MKRISRYRKLTAAAVGVSLAGVLAGCASTTSAASDASGSTSTSTSATSTSDDSSSYKDGTYTTDESYEAPGGEDEVSVTVVLKNDLITSVDVQPVEASGEGERYIARFDSAISAVAVGKSLSGLTISTVAGSSLTSSAFDAALDTIRSDAT